MQEILIKLSKTPQLSYTFEDATCQSSLDVQSMNKEELEELISS